MLIDLDRIEVLKGPQGTLYGGSAMGGAIKYVTRRPELDRFEVTADAGVASVEHGGLSYNADSFANFPLVSGVLALRLGAGYRFDAGYVDNVANGEVQVWPRGATPVLRTVIASASQRGMIWVFSASKSRRGSAVSS